jgi:hypothetical protein
MSEWNAIISVIGTLSGTIVGLLIGYCTSSRIEAKKERHAETMYYRNKLTEHMNDVIQPLFHLTEELWWNLGIVKETIEGRNKIGTLQEWLSATKKANDDLFQFSIHSANQIDILLPNQLSSWVFIPIKNRVDKIMDDLSKEKKPLDEMKEVIDGLMQYQENLKKLLGFETEVNLEDIFPSKRPIK